MNVKLLSIGLLLALAIYGMNTVLADDTDPTEDPIEQPPCDDPLNDGTGHQYGGNHDNGGNQRGDMDGEKSQLKTQLHDGTGLGGAYGYNFENGTCLIE